MKVTEQRIEGTKKILVKGIVKKISEDARVTTDEALRRFIASKTYKLLMNTNTGLWLDSSSKIYDIYISEVQGNLERLKWLMSPDI